MKNFLTNLFRKTKTNVETTFEHASEDIKEVVDAVTEDTSRLMAQAKEKLTETKAQIKEEMDDPDGLFIKAKKSMVETSEKLKAAAKEEWESAAGKMEELKDSFSEKRNDEKPGQTTNEDQI